jgi:hypothetical protein
MRQVLKLEGQLEIMNKLAKRNLKAYYRFPNRKLKTRNGISDLKTEDGTEISDDRQKAEVLNGFFSSVYTKNSLQDTPNNRIVTAIIELSSIKMN